MHTKNNLGEQVRSELKRRNYIFYTLILLSLVYVGFNLVFGDMGLLRYQELKEKKVAIEKDISRLEEENKKLKASIDAYGEDNFYVEKHAREDFGLSGEDDYIFIYKQK
jgi:cell division protein FtsB